MRSSQDLKHMRAHVFIASVDKTARKQHVHLKFCLDQTHEWVFAFQTKTSYFTCLTRRSPCIFLQFMIFIMHVYEKAKLENDEGDGEVWNEEEKESNACATDLAYLPTRSVYVVPISFTSDSLTAFGKKVSCATLLRFHYLHH